jgi:1,2-dihydroxy-3-keto-5-methylthiopentene dioxygenase
MATLTIPDKNMTVEDVDAIRTYLAARGILYTQWTADFEFLPDAEQEEILAAYANVLNPYMAAHGYQTADVISVHPQTPNLSEIRTKFLQEHTHTEDEVRFFVDGQGFFWFNLGAEEPVFCVKCVAGDLLSVPANFKHWFDLGPVAFVKTIRIFTDASGWTPHYTGSGIDVRYRETVVS